MKSVTEVNTDKFPIKISRTDKILVLGSCFAANIGTRLQEEGYDVCVNPFGTIFNPASVASSIARLQSGEPFTEGECVQMGAGSSLWCSFSHYTKFARPTKEEFLRDANQALSEASAFFHACTKVIITFGTAFVFEHLGAGAQLAAFSQPDGRIVSNCLKRDAKEFRRYRMSVDEIVSLWNPLLAGPLADKDVIFTVSPIRHMADTAHGNQLSKSTLLLAIATLLQNSQLSSEPSAPFGARAYFPSYEVVLDELRDYSWYADDLVHPSPAAVTLICDRFLSAVR